MPNNEFGDFQTPIVLATQCLKTLKLPSHARILEPTCGAGSFLQAAADIAPQSERMGVEINPDYAKKASAWGKVQHRNVFELELSSPVWGNTDEPLFIIGNPPWVTSAELRRMNSRNLPPKENFKGAKGLEAILGSSNFDVSEVIILKALRENARQTLTLGMLCKTQVVRNVIEYAARIGLSIFDAAIYRIDAMHWFGAGVDACWFTLKMCPNAKADYTVKIFDDIFDEGATSSARFGVVDSRLVSDVDQYLCIREADGKSPYEWRSGLKHDASKVFELIACPQPTTRSGVTLDLEPEYIFPFLKSTDIFRGRHKQLNKWVIVPQMEFGAETSYLRYSAPKLWNYLMANSEVLDGRKSSIYRNQPRFSVFGHGAYTFAPYKVVISGLHKEPVFRLVTPIENRPVVVDDTCYMLPFDDPTEALIVTTILNSPECLALINSLVFRDSKRPITKKLLARVDLNCLPVEPLEIIKRAQELANDVGLPFDVDRGLDMIGHLGSVEATMVALF